MALPASIFGSNLTDLQSGANAAQGLDYQRANAQDAVNQARLEAFLRLRGQQAQIQAQQNQLAQDRAMRMAELAQQNQQFGTSEANRLTLADKVAASQLAVANASKGGMDPRAFETTVFFNQQQADKFAAAQALSEKRKALVEEAHAATDKSNHSFTWNGPLASAFYTKYGRYPDSAAATRLDTFDTLNAANGLRPDKDPESKNFGGYVISPANQLPLGRLRGGAPNPSVQPEPDNPTPTPQPNIPARFQGGGGASGLPADWGTVPGSPFDRLINGPVAPPVDALAPSTVAPPIPNRTIRVNPDGSLFYVQ